MTHDFWNFLEKIGVPASIAVFALIVINSTLNKVLGQLERLVNGAIQRFESRLESSAQGDLIIANQINHLNKRLVNEESRKVWQEEKLANLEKIEAESRLLWLEEKVNDLLIEKGFTRKRNDPKPDEFQQEKRHD